MGNWRAITGVYTIRLVVVSMFVYLFVCVFIAGLFMSPVTRLKRTVSVCVCVYVCVCVCVWLCMCVAVWCSDCVLGSGPEVPELKPNSGQFSI